MFADKAEFAKMIFLRPTIRPVLCLYKFHHNLNSCSFHTVILIEDIAGKKMFE